LNCEIINYICAMQIRKFIFTNREIVLFTDEVAEFCPDRKA
jgi:hypothetical protein